MLLERKGKSSESIIAGQRTEIVQVQAKQTKASYKEYLLELASGDDTIAVLEEATDQAERKETTFTSSIRAKSRAALLVQGYRLVSKDTQRILVLGNGGVVHTFFGLAIGRSKLGIVIMRTTHDVLIALSLVGFRGLTRSMCVKIWLTTA